MFNTPNMIIILAISTIFGNAPSQGLDVKESINRGFCFGPLNFCAEGYKCEKIECVEERSQKIKGKSIGPCLRGLCPNDYICYIRNNRCYLIE